MKFDIISQPTDDNTYFLRARVRWKNREDYNFYRSIFFPSTLLKSSLAGWLARVDKAFLSSRSSAHFTDKIR